MKKNNFKKAAPKATTPSPSLLRRGMGRFGVSKNENPNRGAVAPHHSPLPKGEGRVRVFNFKRWHKLSAVFVSIAIIGIVVFFQFAPEKATRGTFEPFAV